MKQKNEPKKKKNKTNKIFLQSQPFPIHSMYIIILRLTTNEHKRKEKKKKENNRHEKTKRRKEFCCLFIFGLI